MSLYNDPDFIVLQRALFEVEAKLKAVEAGIDARVEALMGQRIRKLEAEVASLEQLVGPYREPQAMTVHAARPATAEEVAQLRRIKEAASEFEKHLKGLGPSMPWSSCCETHLHALREALRS